MHSTHKDEGFVSIIVTCYNVIIYPNIGMNDFTDYNNISLVSTIGFILVTISDRLDSKSEKAVAK